MTMAVTMGVVMVMVVNMVVSMMVTLGRGLCLAVTHHHRFHQLAHRIFVECHMAGQKTGQPGQHQRLHRELAVGLARGHLIGVVSTALEQVGKQPVQVAVQVAACSRPFKQRRTVDPEALKQVALESVFFFQVATHHPLLSQKPSARSSCSNQSNPMGFTMRLLTTTMRASLSGSALKCWCAQ